MRVNYSHGLRPKFLVKPVFGEKLFGVFLAAYVYHFMHIRRCGELRER